MRACSSLDKRSGTGPVRRLPEATVSQLPRHVADRGEVLRQGLVTSPRVVVAAQPLLALALSALLSAPLAMVPNVFGGREQAASARGDLAEHPLMSFSSASTR